MIDKPGIYRDIDEATYFTDPCPSPSLTQSVAKVLLDYSPAHARLEHPRLAPPKTEDEPAEKYTAAQAIGNAAHKLVLGRGREIAVGDYDDFRGKEAKAWRDEQTAAGKLVVLSKHMTRAEAMVKAARQQLADASHDAFTSPGEIMLAWQEGNIWLRSLVDWMDGGCVNVFDYKTSAMSCAPHVVDTRPSDAGWNIQAAMIERGLDVLDPDNAGRRKFYFVAQENFEPFALSVVKISEADLTLGRKDLDVAIATWRTCLHNNRWPAYGVDTVISRPKPWLETKTLEREIAHHERSKIRPEQAMRAG